MRILYDSKQPTFKSPFGTLTPGQECTLHIHIPSQIGTSKVSCVFCNEDGSVSHTEPFVFAQKKGAYDIWECRFAFDKPALYFYHFLITAKSGTFHLLKYGDDTNMESGDQWQLSCVSDAYPVPDWAKGATIYQIFPDRFCKSGDCDLTGKLEPYTLHESWDEEVSWQPTPDGKVLNNDFYGGNFRGIAEKLPYLASLGITILYLNPISKSFSSHRYDTGDYKTPDPMLGTMEDFTALCDAAHALGMRVLLDGVYSHTGSNSLYFNREGNFDDEGAYQSRLSPYFSWYSFQNWPDQYRSWWGFETLPTLNKLDPAFLEYLITGEDSVVAHWLRAGCDGFRLDVADELPNEFMAALKKRVRELRPDALVLGEVWEDASNKISYAVRRRYFVDGTLDSVMNYPFRTAILNFLRGQDSGEALAGTVMTIAENYPPDVLLANMNLLGTHDTPRILTALADDFDGSLEENARRHLSPQQYPSAREQLMMASFLQYTLPGSPSLYYGDEAGMEGHKDPFNRRPYPWGGEDPTLLAHFRQLGSLRKTCEPLRLGDIRFFSAGDRRLGFRRCCNGKAVRIYVNRSNENWDVPAGGILLERNTRAVAPDWLSIAPMGLCVVEEA